MKALFLDVIPKPTIPIPVESKFASLTTERRPGGIFDVSSRLHRNLGFEWRPIQKSSMLNALCKHMKGCRSFLKAAVKFGIVSKDDLVTLFYDHIPFSESAQNSNPHFAVLIVPSSGEAFIQAPSVELFSQNSLTNLLDILEELECTKVYATIKKGDDMKNIMRQFIGSGFQMVAPSIKQMDGYAFLGYEL